MTSWVLVFGLMTGAGAASVKMVFPMHNLEICEATRDNITVKESYREVFGDGLIMWCMGVAAIKEK
jgi:hypothetical protein